MIPSVTTCVLIAVAGAAPAGNDPVAWLEAMNEAVNTLNYEGEFVHVHDGYVENMWVVHRVEDGTITERLVAQDGSGREIIRDEEKVTCVFAGERSVFVEKSRASSALAEALPPEHAKKISRYYHFSVAGKGRIANRDTRVINVDPRTRKSRYGYRLWLDEETAMPLKSEVVDHRNEVIESILFSRIRFPDSIPVAMVTSSIPRDDFVYHEPKKASERADAGRLRWEAGSLPEGFTLVASYVEHDDDGREMEHHVFSDGLATISVFVEPATDPATIDGLKQFGATDAFVTTREGHELTVIGEVPSPTLRDVAHSMRLVGGRDK